MLLFLTRIRNCSLVSIHQNNLVRLLNSQHTSGPKIWHTGTLKATLKTKTYVTTPLKKLTTGNVFIVSGTV